ncbi:DUF559 domain-containing protein [Verrucosispora sp. WMMA2121]|uniref:DUF559 domain-containing protein n=1 Tax=Verrucosispora sp. WMMA2121 TaxID=3015164 RepID=UPI0022B7406E|nr:DUF559 domain-containing protein [Verrucosispora sp. WMMA2121]MCZ7422866.1 DUF559 domain-containing protein [Verrucosispora sp. WMMA2121]
MDGVLRSLVEAGGGGVTRARALEVVPPWTLRRAYRSGWLRRVLPAVYVDTSLLAASDSASLLATLTPEVARRAALAYADGRAALSALTALDVYGLRPQPAGEPVYLDVPAGIGLRSKERLVVRHRTAFAAEPPHVVVRRSLPLVRLDAALVHSWPLLSEEGRIGPIVRAVNDRMTTGYRLRDALAPKLKGRAALSVLIDRLEAGCRSPLEIWGHDRVFTGPGMPELRRQVRVRVGKRTMYLDLFAEEERVNIELDGATSHGDPRQREIDLRRDALLATVGILVVRFSHRRLHGSPTRCAGKPWRSSPAAVAGQRLSEVTALETGSGAGVGVRRTRRSPPVRRPPAPPRRP